MSLAIVIHAAKDLRIEPQAVAHLGPLDVEVEIGAGGICGSDLHYYLHGGFGTVRLREPMILGHEIAGTVRATGAQISGVKPGDRVAVDPSRSCGTCRFCELGLQNHCLDMRFYGSAMPFPHIQGGFRQRLVVEERQCVAIPDAMSLSDAAFAEPLAVCLHAKNRAGDLAGKRVLVTGCGPIGALTIAAARLGGAAEIVATDIAGRALDIAGRMGADRTINVATQAEALAPFKADKGAFDVMFEASGAAVAIRTGLELLRPRGILVQVGLGGDAELPLNMIVAKEIDFRGTFRFHAEFKQAVQAIASGRIDVKPLLTDVIPMQDAIRAFDLAADKSRAMKVQLSFA